VIALQTWLELAEHRVVIPFARELSDAIPTVAVRLRRDFPALLSLIRAHVILHRASRDRSSEGEIIAAEADYYAVRDLIQDLVGQAAGVSVPPLVRDTVEAVQKLSKKLPCAVPQKALVDALG
jgi:hypothetical protein